MWRKILQERKIQISPIVMSLNKIDFWYWCRYFIDIHRVCPYDCSYCNTKNQTAIKGIDFVSGIPREKEVIGLGFLSDIYNKESTSNEATREILEILNKNKYPINILTKSTQIVQDYKLLKKFSENNNIRITFTILTPDDKISSALEGFSPSPSERLKALRFLSDNNIPCGIAVTPIIPCVNDDKDALSYLIKEAKNMGAKWVLFSGYNPTMNFFRNPGWKKSSKIHSDNKKLKYRYREIKRFMINLLYNENLPMRIPRIKLDILNNKYYSYITSEYLFNISYYYELLENELESTRYLRTAYKINNITRSLKSIVLGKKLGYIRGVNPEIEKVIEEIVKDNKSTIYTELYNKLISEVKNAKITT